MTCPEGEGPRTPIEELLHRLAAAALLGEAEAVMRGKRHLTIEHGYPETDDETARLEQLRTVAWRGADGARTRCIGGGGDYTTITVEGPSAEAFVDQLTALATALGPSWWRVRPSAR